MIQNFSKAQQYIKLSEFTKRFLSNFVSTRVNHTKHCITIGTCPYGLEEDIIRNFIKIQT